MNKEIKPLRLIVLIILIIYVSFRWSESNSKKEKHELMLLPTLVASGDAEAQYNLGVRYEEGNGFTKTDRIAYAFFLLAAPRHEEAKKRLDALKAKLPPHIIEAGNELAKKMDAEKAEQVRLAKLSEVFLETERDRERYSKKELDWLREKMPERVSEKEEGKATK
jgi:TPR repeat protein